MTIESDVSEFPAIAHAAHQLDPHRQRQVCAFLAERYGYSLQPGAKKITVTPSKNNRSEFAAIETATEELDALTPDQQRQAVAILAGRFHWKVAAAYKPPSGGFKPKRKLSKG
jgi:hypothetical protein